MFSGLNVFSTPLDTGGDYARFGRPDYLVRIPGLHFIDSPLRRLWHVALERRRKRRPVQVIPLFRFPPFVLTPHI